MRKLIHKLVTAFLLMALPLQGLSAALMPFHCAPDDPHASAVASDQHRHASVGHEHDRTTTAAAQYDGVPASHEAGHSCCNHVSTGAPSIAVLAVMEPSFLSANLLFIAPSLFFPERLLRPPRT